MPAMSEETFQELLKENRELRNRVAELEAANKGTAELQQRGAGSTAEPLIANEHFMRETEARVRIESNLREQAEKYRTLFEEAPDGIALADTQTGILVDCNLALAEMVERTREELIGSHQSNLHPPSERSGEFSRTFVEHRDNPEGQFTSDRLLTRSGKVKDVQIKGRRITLGGRQFMQGIFRDLTERRQTEDALQESEMRLQNLSDNLPNGLVYQVDSGIDGKERQLTYISAGVEQLHEMTVAEMLKNTSAIYDQMVEEDRAEVEKREAHAVQGLTTFSVEARVRMPSGRIRWSLFTSAPRRSPNQHLIWDGIELDITERKRAEEALRVSEQKYRALVETTDTGFVILGPRGEVLDANAGYVRLTGHRRLEEILGRSVPEWTAEDDRERNAAEVRKCFEQGFVRNLEINYVDREGKLTPIEINATVYHTQHDAQILTLCRDITERKKAEEALRESKERFRTLADNSPDLVSRYDRALCCTFANPAMEKRFGMALKDVIGKSLTELGRPPVAIAAVEAQLRAVFETGEPRSLELYTDGQWSEVKLVPERDCRGELVSVLHVARDITARKRAEEELRDARQSYESIFRLSPEAIVITTQEDGRCIDVNEAHERMTGYRREEVLGRTSVEIGVWVSTDERDSLTRVLAEQGYVSNMELRFRRKSGEVYDVLMSAVSADIRGARRIISIVTDITERKRAEEEQMALERRLQHAQRLESIGILAGGIAHDFNNLLTIITGNISLAKLEATSGCATLEYLENIDQVVKRAADLTRQMLAYAGKDKPRAELVDLTRLVGEMVKLLGASVSKKAHLVFELPQGLPVITADGSQLNQVVMNLLLNASEALGGLPGTIRIRTGTDELDEIRSRGLLPAEPIPAGSYVYFQVEDTGCGMDEATQARIFDPFFSTKFSGRGLGLSAVLGIVRAHRGAIRVQSKPGLGSTFTVLLPASQGSGAGALSRAELDSTATQRSLSGTILIADDEEMLRKVLRRLLERMGLRVLEASDGVEALEVYRQHQQEIDMVFLDYKMPRLDGAETLAALQGLDKGVRAILSSGYPEEEAIREHSALGWAGFVHKPYHPGQLDEIIQSLLRQKPTTSKH